jgi:hypothetical protein
MGQWHGLTSLREVERLVHIGHVTDKGTLHRLVSEDHGSRDYSYL